MEYRLGRSRNGDEAVVIEPQAPDYWPQTPQLGNTDVLVLSRFAYMRRRGNEMVLESPRAGALFRICDPKIATALAMLSAPRPIKQLRRHDGFPGVELLALLLDSQILFKVDPARDSGLRAAEGDDNLVLWDFHDLLFHARSTQWPARQPTGRGLSVWGRDGSATGGAASLARTSICARSRPRVPRQCRPRQSFCANVIRRVPSTTADRSRSPRFHGFSTAPRGSGRPTDDLTASMWLESNGPTRTSHRGPFQRASFRRGRNTLFCGRVRHADRRHGSGCRWRLFVGGRMAAAGHDVTFIARGAHPDAIRRDGLKIESTLGDLHLKDVNVTEDQSKSDQSTWCYRDKRCGIR